MTQMYGIKMKTTVNKEVLLSRLKTNAARHETIVKEALIAYRLKASNHLILRAEAITKGETLSLHFDFRPPEDHREVYRNCIRMIEFNLSETIELEADDFQTLMLDQWSWKRQFLESSMTYSHEAMVDLDGLSMGREE